MKTNVGGFNLHSAFGGGRFSGIDVDVGEDFSDPLEASQRKSDCVAHNKSCCEKTPSKRHSVNVLVKTNNSKNVISAAADTPSHG